MSTNPLASPKFRAFDSNGDPLSGGKLYSYSAGTTNALSTYTTRAGSVANANPVILDANGEADVWMTPGVDYKFVLKNSADVTQWTVDNVPSPAEASTSDSVVFDPGGRITLTTATPVTTADVTGATTVYYALYKHSKVPIYDGTSWTLQTFAELSQTTTDTTKSPAAVAVSSNYDMFVWNDSGTIRLSRGPAWTSDTGRGSGAGTTQITQVNGRYVNAVSITNGPAANRGTYVGTIRSDASSQINDSAAKRHVWNTYNRAPRGMRITDSTDSWSYTSATLRQARASTANQIDLVRGLDEDAVHAFVRATALASLQSENVSAGIGLDSTTTLVTGHIWGNRACPNSTQRFSLQGEWAGMPGLGRHTLVWLERGPDGTTAITFYGDVGTSDAHAGIHGTCLG